MDASNPLSLNAHSLCKTCRGFDPDSSRQNLSYTMPRNYGAEHINVQNGWDGYTMLEQPPKAFWLGTAGEVEYRGSRGCELCEFVTDHLCILWRLALAADKVPSPSELSEFLTEVKLVPRDHLLCIFRWRRIDFLDNSVKDISSRQSPHKVVYVFVGAASKQEAESVSDRHLDKILGSVEYSHDRVEQVWLDRRGEVKATKQGYPFFDLQWANDHFKACLESHVQCKQPYKIFGSRESRQDLARTMRLVDVQRRRIVQGLPPVEYATLSYVWGSASRQTPSLRARSKFLRDEDDRSVYHELQERLPATIEDALKVTCALGLRFLWVDSLCIIQDSKVDKRTQLGKMAAIYANAEVCIVDGAGDSAEAGLSGISSRRRKLTVHLNNDIEIKPYSKVVRSISKKSPWLRRGWTFQERLLSRRCLIFYKAEAVFLCTGTNQEISSDLDGDLSDIDSQPHRLRPSLRIARDLEVNATAEDTAHRRLQYRNVLAMFTQAAENFSARQLTYESDVLNAFSGISLMFAEALHTLFSSGVPLRAMHRMLLWTPINGGRRSEHVLVDLPLSEVRSSDNRRRHTPLAANLPSWAWTSWQGQIRFPRSYDGTIGGTQIVILRPKTITLSGAMQSLLRNPRLTIIENSLVTLTKIAWISLDIVFETPTSMPFAWFKDPRTGSRTLSSPRVWRDSYKEPPGAGSRDRTLGRKCTIERPCAGFSNNQVVLGCFIQLGALQQYHSSWTDRDDNRLAYEDECYLLLVDVEPFPFDDFPRGSSSHNFFTRLRTSKETRRRYWSERMSYNGPLHEHPILPDGATRRHEDIVIDIDSDKQYAEDAVFIAKRNGIGHIPESVWRAAKPKDAIVILT